MNYLKKGSIRLLLSCVMLFALAFVVCTPAEANPEYLAMTRKAETKHGIPFGLLGGICEQESNWRPDAIGADGEIGLCQLKFKTARRFCPSCDARVPVLYQGMQSQKVMLVKTKLFQKKYFNGPLDEHFDLQLHVAITSFQKDHQLRADGIVGYYTWEKLFGRPMTGNFLLDQLYDPETNIEYAAKYLVYLMQHLETRDYELLATAYNAGENGKSVNYILKVRKRIAKHYAGKSHGPRLD